MKAIAVIGANFGDEGKGRMVDHFAAQSPVTLVVRFNGGAQAGHTVVTPDGKRHVFSHFGAGTLAGAQTFLSHFFVVNPFLFMREAHLLKDIKTRVYIDPNAPLTTPWDMYINREVENSRGKDRHGSCGYGIAETVERILKKTHATFASDLVSPIRLREKLDKIRTEWVPARLKALKIEKPSDWFQNIMATPQLVDEYICDCEIMHKMCTPLLAFEIANEKRWSQLVFEGAQGLCLHESHKFFPHVTRSKTGIENVAALCKIAKIKEIEAVYVTRAYATRHGAGPFPTEDSSLKYEDKTNVDNDWQGSIRFGHLDIDLLSESIKADAAKAKGIQVFRSLAVTCLDQIPDGAMVKKNNKLEKLQTANIPLVARVSVGAKKVYTSYSSSRKA